MATNSFDGQMLQAPIEGYEDAIVVPPIQYGEARDWLDKEPPRSILTWDDLVSKFINQYFPPLKTTYYRNEIITFYNSLNSNDQDALDSAAGGNFLDKMPQEGLAIIERTVESSLLRVVLCDSRWYGMLLFLLLSPSNNSFDMQQIAASLEDKMTIKMNQMMKEMKALVVTTPAPVKAVKEANDAVLKNVQNQGQNLQNQMANVTSLLTSLCNNFKNSASTSNPGTLPSQTVTNPRQQINAITTRSGKTLEEPLIPLVPTPDVSISQNEPNLETSTEKVQNPNLENTAHVPLPGEEDSIFMEIPNPKAKKTVNVEIQDLNSPRPDSYPSKTSLSEWMKRGEKPIHNKCRKKSLRDPGKFLYPCALQELNRTMYTINESGIAEDVIVRVDGFTFLADFVVVNFEPDPRVPIILGRPFLRTAKALIDLYEEKLTLRVGKEELVYYADKFEKNKEKNFVHAISIIDFSKDNPFSGSTTNTLPPSSSSMKTSDNFEKFTDELAPLDSLPPGNDDSTFKKDFHEVNFQVYSNTLFEFDVYSNLFS
ncbi:reverse transcriptase domain-containing protein [Tanacetum coccineum]